MGSCSSKQQNTTVRSPQYPTFSPSKPKDQPQNQTVPPPKPIDKPVVEPFHFTCPLKHELKNIECTYPQSCQKCNQKSMFYFHCTQCSYHVCLSHFQHKEFCKKIVYKCFIVGYFGQGNSKRCMICLEKGPIVEMTKYLQHTNKFITEMGEQTFSKPGIACENCNLRICIKCTTMKHTDVIKSLDLYYSPKDGPKTNCFDCKKQIVGGLSCKNCRGSFCKTCQSSYLPPEQNKTTTPSKKECSIKICSICLQNVTEGEIKLACDHSFHGKCLASWKNRSCPNCRSAY